VNIIWALGYPDVTRQWVSFLTDMYEDGGLIPRGPSGHSYTFVMISAHSTPFIVGAYMKGIRRFDVETAYEGMRTNAFPGGLMSKAGYEHDTCIDGGVEHYIAKGFIPDDRKARHGWHADGVSQTLEYAYDDWCLAQMAKALGKQDDYERFMRRATNYRNMFDAETGFMRPRNSDGSWMEPFKPTQHKGYCEGTAWQYTFFVPHDVAGLARLMGGADAFNAKLNEAFERSVEHDFRSPYVNYGNQPSIEMAHLFNYAGAPWLAQKWVRAVKRQAFSAVAVDQGYGGDEDQGQGGGVSMLMALGLFQVRGGCANEPVYEITAPIFDRITIHLDSDYYPGKKFEIVTTNNSPENVYIQSARLDGKPLNRPWFYHRELVDGGRLELVLGPEPNKQWGAGLENAPPSMSDEQ
jgi:predicted alpha-1,2-mannosidase